MKVKTKKGQSYDTAKVIGTIAVDSGCIMICDPVSVVGERFTEEDYQKHLVGEMFNKEGKLTGKTNNKFGVVSDTRWGDGFYEVLGLYDAEGKIKALVVDFENEFNQAMGEPEFDKTSAGKVVRLIQIARDIEEYLATQREEVNID